MTADVRKILALTTSRADWGHLSSPLQHLMVQSQVHLSLVAMGSHLSPEFGMTVDQIESDGFKVDHRIECLLSSDSDVGMAKTIGVATLSIAELLDRERPDLLLLIADRYEMLAPAAAALALRIPVAHIEGGEVSEGAIDHAVRQALTAIAHIHLVPTETARRRVLQFGEEPWRVHTVGAPSIDHLHAGTSAPRSEVEEALEVSLDPAPLVVAWHPVTLDEKLCHETDPLFEALEEVEGSIIFCFPNADAGSREIKDRVQQFCDNRVDSHLFVNLRHQLYWGLLQHAAAIVGNSSSGIMEAPSLSLPCLNIGRRQQGRERSRCIVDVPAHKDAIIAGIEFVRGREFRETLTGMENPYGDGRAGQRIAEILATIDLGPRLLEKRALPADRIPEPPCWPEDEFSNTPQSLPG
ncbi:MAG: UDP-N-acetylglucosamine 2-epimerase [Planctomycetota bacterium]|nr:UDP-N-acetylglucosamine 2-epimerase [Planctomycetota bacterium]